MKVKELWSDGNMTNGDEMPKTVKRTVKKRSEFPMWVWGILGVMLIAGLAIYAGVNFVQPGTPQVAISGGGSPAGPVAPAITTPKVISRSETFEQLVEKWNTPEDVQAYMAKNFRYQFRESGPYKIGKAQDLLSAGGKGDYFEFANFFATALANKGCWQWKNIHMEVFTSLGYNQHKWDVGTGRRVIVYNDPRDGAYYYFVPEPPNFPIYKIGASDDPIPLEEKRLGEWVDKGSIGFNNYC